MKKTVLCLFLIIFSFLSAETVDLHSNKKPQKTVCLNMIVKDEKDVIERCLKSAKPFIDYWVIFDTGSTDGTQEVIKNYLKDIPGELHQSKWVNFEHNRNEALQATANKADYLLMIDADEILEYQETYHFPELDKDCYYITVRQVQAADCNRVLLINSRINWRWEGVLHEVLRTDDLTTPGFLTGIRNVCNTAIGARSKEPNEVKYMRDAEVLEAALKKEPDNSRYMFYLGVSYAAAGRFELAEKAFAKRIAMETLDVQETYQAYYNMGIAQDKMDRTDDAIETFLKAHQFRPTRAESLFRMAALYRKQNKILLGYLLSKYALTFPFPQGDACIEYMAYDYEMLVEFANCALLLGKFDEGLSACTQLLNNPHLPEDMKGSVTSNYHLAMKAVYGEAPSTQRLVHEKIAQ